MEELIGGGDDGVGGKTNSDGGNAQLPGESIEDYIKRLKELGLYGGDIKDQPLVGGGPSITGFANANPTPGSSSGMSAGSNQLSGGMNPGMSAFDNALSGKGVWEPDNSKSGPVGGAYMGGGGGGSSGGGQHAPNMLAAAMGGGGGGASATYIKGGIDNGGLMAPPINRGSPNSENALLKLLQYVQPAYQRPVYQPPNFSGGPGTNYLQQLMRSRG